ncbi:hypothetical protein PIB30_072741 [Stylosanthes scabra]|uniref:Uncharacterized protein n=1 Tax=Stylosanthes scabra TaxID=79078 RepID=A0ABU6YLS3_9FABA|nr:hypothetical protein [Stylosanthes scabra]
MLVHEPNSRFGPALRLPRRSCAESAAFEVSRLNLGSTPVHLGDPVQWVNQPMVHLVNGQLVLTGIVARCRKSECYNNNDLFNPMDMWNINKVLNFIHNSTRELLSVYSIH